MSIDKIIDLTKSSSSGSEVSKVARMPTEAEDSYSDSDLFPDSSDDEVVFVKAVEPDAKPAAVVDLSEPTTTPEGNNRSHEQNIPALELVESLMATNDDLQEGELLMDPEDRARVIVWTRSQLRPPMMPMMLGAKTQVTQWPLWSTWTLISWLALTWLLRLETKRN